jgi:hypothetical protein
MSQNNSNIHAMETFLVAKTGTTLYNAAGAGNFINNLSTGGVVLPDGSVGMFSDSSFGTVGLNVATDATPAFGEAPLVYLAQGTPHSANPSAANVRYPLSPEPFIRSAQINGRNPVLVTKQLAEVGTHSTWIVGSTVAGRTITALDNTEYSLKLTFEGMRETVFNGCHVGSSAMTPSFVTPNYTTLATQDPVDHLIQNLSWNINRNSTIIAGARSRYGANAPVVALAINVAGGAGTNIGGGSPLAANQVVPVVNTNVGVRSITLTQAMADSIKNAAVKAASEFAGAPVAIAALTWSILTIDTTTAGLTAGGVADLIMLVALDETPAFEERIYRKRTRLRVGLPVGFDFTTVNCKEYEELHEGHGQSAYLDLWYRNTHGQRKYNLRQRELPITEYDSPIVNGLQYIVYTVNHFNNQQIDITNSTINPFATIVCIPSTESALVTAFEGMMNSWLTSNSHPSIDTV